MHLLQLVSRVISMTLTVAVIFVASRALVRALPGDPIESIVAESGTRIPVEELRRELGLDRPFWSALAQDAGRLVSSGDLGRSLVSGNAITPLLIGRFANTSLLVAAALVLGAAMSLAAGLLAAAAPSARVRRAADVFCDGFGSLMAAMPTPWLGPLLMYLLAVRLPLFPVSGHVALPALTLSLGFTGLWARLIRDRVGESVRFGSVRGARARGLGELRVALKYGLAPVSGALAGYFGTQAGALLAGAFVTEVVFDWEGLGSLFVHAVLSRDYPVVEAAVFVGGSATLLGTLAGDWIRAWIDPRGEAV